MHDRWTIEHLGELHGSPVYDSAGYPTRHSDTACRTRLLAPKRRRRRARAERFR